MAPERDRDPAEKQEPARPRAVALRWAGVGVVAAMLFAAPLAFGAVEWWAWGTLWFAAALATAIALAVWVIEGRASLIFAPVLALPALLAVVAIIQLVPLPPGVFPLAGERTAAVYKVLFGGTPHRISLAPGATVEAFFKITLVAMAAFATLALVRTRAMLFTLVGASILAALVAAGVGIIQEKGHGEKIYGLRDISAGAETHFRRSALLDPALSSGIGHVESVKGENGAVFFQQSVNIGDVFGPYADSNHFGGLMEIVLPVVLALLAALLAARRSGWGEEGGFTATAEGGLALLLLFTLFVGVGATVYCGSSGALGALAAGFTVVLVIMLFTRQASAAPVVLCIVLAAGALLAVPWSRGGIYERMLAKVGGRAAVWKTARRAAADFPIVGGGLGTYAYVIPHYEHTEERHLFAHNDYLQLAMEGGLVAGAGAGLMILWQAGVLARGAYRHRERYGGALCAGALGALAAVAFHSLFDFNMHVPANTLTLAVLVSAGTAAARTRVVDIETVELRERVLFSGRGKAVVATVVLLAGITATAFFLADFLRAEGTGCKARVFLANAQTAGPRETAARIKSLAEEISRARRLAPYDARLAYQASRLSALRVRYEDSPGEVARVKSESLEDAVEAAHLAPSYTFYAMTAVTMGAKGLGVLERWEMSAFAYKRALAELFFQAGRDDDGLSEMREAVALEVPTSALAPERAMGAVKELLGRFGTYDRIASAAPDSFGGHMLFGKALAAAGLGSAAGKEFVNAAALATDARREDGFNQLAATQLAKSLVSYGKRDEAGEFYATTLQRRPWWQVLRLSYAGFLVHSGQSAPARAQIDTLLSANVPKWLSDRALALRESLGRK